MTMFDYQSKVSELFVSAGTANAVVTAFAHQFVDGTQNDMIIRAEPEHYAFLFHALSEAVHAVFLQAKELNEIETVE